MIGNAGRLEEDLDLDSTSNDDNGSECKVW